MKTIKLKETDIVFIRDGGEDGIGCGSVNQDGLLYFINQNTGEALQLPEKYKDTPIILYHPCGGYQEGLIMVSLLGEVDLQYHHTFYDTAGIWGWLDLEGNEVIPPQYVYAMSFYNGHATVCKGDWTVDESGHYWCENEQWGVIDKTGKEVVPCRFDEIFYIQDTDRYILCHEGGWQDGHNCIYDIEAQKVILTMDFDFDNGYMFNECFYSNGCIFFDDHQPGEEIDYLYAYLIKEEKWVLYHEKYEQRRFNGKTKMVINRDGEDIIIF